MDKAKVDLTIDNSYLKINRKLNIFNGLWPYRPESDKIFRRIIIYTVLITLTFPHLYGIYKQCGKDVAICAENFAGLSYLLGVITKYTVPIVSREKFETVYKKITENWATLTDPEEITIMENYGKLGRLKSAMYFGYCSLAGFCFSQLTIVPVILDFIIPLNQSRNKILVTNAEYPFDPFDHYYELYLMYFTVSVVSVSVLASTDSTYTVIIHQSLGIFSIVKHRLKNATKQADDDISCRVIVSAINMHKQAIEFLELVESTYQLAFLSFIAVTVVFLICGSIIIVESFGDILNLLRTSLFEMGAMIHIFFISWPGQLVIDYTKDLYVSSYTNEWYSLSKRARTLLIIMMMRCLKPCLLTAGGFYVMNFENYGAIVKTTLSYVAVAMSIER